MLLYENNYELLYKSSEIGVQYFGFITPFFNTLYKNKEIVVDATCMYLCKTEYSIVIII